MISASHNRCCSAGFTLVELLVSMSILSLILLVLISITSQTSKTWRYTTGKIEEFRESRAAFETITSRLRQATLNTYWDYDYDAKGLPIRYARRSDLRFTCGQANAMLGAGPKGETRVTHAVFFHAPLGMVDTTNTTYRGLENLLNVWGYYVEFNSDAAFIPAILATAPGKAQLVKERYRFRIMEFRQQSEELRTYSYTSGLAGSTPAAMNYVGADWYRPAANVAPPGNASQPIAENIIALILVPRLSKFDESQLNKGSDPTTSDYSPLAPKYAYDSSPIVTKDPSSTANDPATNPINQLPPLVQVTMVAIDETTAVRMRLDQNSQNVFSIGAKFTDTNAYSTDLLAQRPAGAAQSLEDLLISLKANYRIFSSTVPIRAAKWSRVQKN